MLEDYRPALPQACASCQWSSAADPGLSKHGWPLFLLLGGGWVVEAWKMLERPLQLFRPLQLVSGLHNPFHAPATHSPPP